MRKIYLILWISFLAHDLFSQMPMVKKLDELSTNYSNFQETNRIENAEEIGFYEKVYQGVNSPRQSITDSQGNTYITGTSSHIDAPQGNILTLKYDAS